MRWVLAAKNRLGYELFQLFNALFYRFVLGRHVPFAAQLEKTITSWERRNSRDQWETQYLSGKWAKLEQLDELARYSVIVGYMAYLKPQGAVLDVGCGEGILFKRYKPHGYSRYLGIDISEVALAKLAEQQDENTAFVRVEAEAYRPTELFDVIVFSEALYYFQAPLTVIERYSHALQQDGILIISTYARSRRAMAILRQIKTKYSLLDEARIAHQSQSWVCTVLRPHEASPNV